MSNLYSVDTFTGAPGPTGGAVPGPGATMPTTSGTKYYIVLRWGPAPFVAGTFFDWIVTFGNGIFYRQRIIFTSPTQIKWQMQSNESFWVFGHGTGLVTLATHNAAFNDAIFPIPDSYGHFMFRWVIGATTTGVDQGFRGHCPIGASENDITGGSFAGHSTPTSSVFTTNVGPSAIIGGYAPDMTGRVPDGGGVPALAAGAWAAQVPIRSGFGDSDGFFCIIQNEVRHTYLPNASTFFWDEYNLAGTGIGAEQSAEATLQFHNGNGLFGGAMVRRSGGYGYELQLIQFANRLQLIRRSPPATATVLANAFLPGSQPLNTDIKVRLCVITSGAVQRLTGMLNGKTIFTYDDAGPGAFLTGEPGLILQDNSRPNPNCAFRGLSVSRFEIAGPDAGSPGGPGPVTPGTPGRVWGVEGGVYREAPAPSPSTNAVQPWGAGAARGGRKGWVSESGAWRLFAGGDPDTHGDPGDGTPATICGVTAEPPTTPPTPIGTRIFFCYGLPASQLNGPTPFETLVDNTLPNRIAGVLSAATAGGYRVLATLGGYKKFKTGNDYDPGLMNAYIDAFAPVAGTMSAAAGSGRLPFFQLMDDQHSTDQWGIIIAGTEVDRIIARLKGVVSGLRVGVRLTPRKAIQFGGPLNADFYIAQYLSSLGNVTAWRDAELAAAASLGKLIIFSLNFFNGGNGSSGLVGSSGMQMSTAEVLSYGSVLAAAPASSGLGGWKYGSWIGQSGMTDALVTDRNIMTAA